MDRYPADVTTSHDRSRIELTHIFAFFKFKLLPTYILKF